MAWKQLWLGSMVVPSILIAQTSPQKKAAASISEADVRQRIGIVADDSMGGRNTPSHGLDATADYVASEFKRFGLRPAGDSGGYIQRYLVNVTAPNPDSSFLEFANANGVKFRLGLYGEVAVQGRPPVALTTLPVTVVGGVPDSTAASADFKDHLVLWVGDWSKGVPNVQAAATVIQRLGARAIIAVINNDSIAGQAGIGRTQPVVGLGPPRPSTPQTGWGFFAIVRDRSLIDAVPEAAQLLEQLRASPTPVVSATPDWTATMIAKPSDAKAVGAPNTVGILEGTDPVLKREYIVISAHMDHVGSGCSGITAADTVCNGADDDGSGTVGVLELAEALSQPDARPKRSVIFLTVSGEERGLWGSAHFANHPPVDIKSIVADLNMDMIGRNGKDSIVAIGKEHSDLGKTVDQVAAAHPELHLAVLDDQWPAENLYYRSDHYNFAVKGVPILFFTSGLHADYHAATDSPDRLDAEKESRVLQLVYYLAQEIGNRPLPPRWKPESYQKIVVKR